MGATATVKAPRAGATKGKEGAKAERPAKGRTTSQEDTSGGRARRAEAVGKRNRALGRKGEDAAARYLEQRGYQIVARNWTCVAGEADIVARDEDWLVFVEVKTRRNTDKGFPSEAVNEKKRERYERIALAWAASHSDADVPVRFDVVSIVVIGKDKAMIRHHMNAFTR